MREELQKESVEKVDPEAQFEWRALVVRSLLVLLGFMVAFVLFYVLAKDWIQSVGSWVGHNLGLGGVGAGVFVIDFFITPASPALFFPFVLDWEPVSLLAVMSGASIAAGCSGYFVGTKLDRFPRIRKWTLSFRRQGEALIGKYGFWAVAIGASIPFPYSMVCWTAGMVRVPFSHLLFGSLFRIPRMIVYYLAIRSGIGLFVPS